MENPPVFTNPLSERKDHEDCKLERGKQQPEASTPPWSRISALDNRALTLPAAARFDFFF